jgi:hypothetical protein
MPYVADQAIKDALNTLSMDQKNWNFYRVTIRPDKYFTSQVVDHQIEEEAKLSNILKY